MKLKYIIIVWMIFPLALLGQIERVSESEVQAEALFLDALQLRILEKYDEAIASFKNLEEKDPSNDVVLFELAKIYWVKRMDQDAISHIRRAIAANPGKSIYKEFLIDIYTELKDYNALNEVLSEFIDAGNYQETYYMQLVNSYQRSGDNKNALKVLDELEARVGYKSSIGQRKAGIYSRLKNERKLVRELKKLSQAFPEDTDVLLRVAVLYQSVKKDEEAYSIYERILEIDPNHATANTKMATWNKRATTKNQFLSSLDEMISNMNIPLDEKIKQLVPYVPKLKPGSELNTEMLKLMEMLDKLYPENPKVNALYGDIFFNSGQLSQSVPYYQKTLQLNKSVFMVWKNLMLAQDNTLDFEGLKETSEAALNYFPNQAVSYYYAGKAEIELNQPELGMEWLREGILMVGDNERLKSEFYLLKSHYFILKGKETEAKDMFNLVNSSVLGPRHAFYFELKGDIEFISGEHTKAIESWKQSILNGGRKNRIETKISQAENQ